MPHKVEHYLPVVLTALTVLILGCANFKPFQTKDENKKSSGQPSYLWLSVLSLLVGLLSVWFYNQ